MFEPELLDRIQRQRAERVVEVVSQAFGVAPESILGGGKKGHITAARHAACWVLRELGWTLAEIGTAMRRDHSTVHHAIEQAGKRMRAERDYRLLVLPVLDEMQRDNPVLERAELDERLLLSIIRASDDLARLCNDMGALATKLAQVARMSLEASQRDEAA
mgnify:CR=1 FL=1